MTKKDKAIIAFMVSVGLFSLSQARQYVKQLSAKEKNKIFSVAKMKDKNIVLCESVNTPVELKGKS
ncbi:MAG: hypothetical protein AB1637_04660 [Elusimicrobiota bacterium]